MEKEYLTLKEKLGDMYIDKVTEHNKQAVINAINKFINKEESKKFLPLAICNQHSRIHNFAKNNNLRVLDIKRFTVGLKGTNLQDGIYGNEIMIVHNVEKDRKEIYLRRGQWGEVRLIHSRLGVNTLNALYKVFVSNVGNLQELVRKTKNLKGLFNNAYVPNKYIVYRLSSDTITIDKVVNVVSVEPNNYRAYVDRNILYYQSCKMKKFGNNLTLSFNFNEDYQNFKTNIESIILVTDNKDELLQFVKKEARNHYKDKLEKVDSLELV